VIWLSQYFVKNLRQMCNAGKTYIASLMFVIASHANSVIMKENTWHVGRLCRSTFAASLIHA